MFNNIKIKRTPKIWKYLPFFAGEMASSIYPNIYLPEKEYEDWNSPNPSILIQSIIIHEKTHLMNWKKIGVLKFAYNYMFNKPFRLEQELIPIKEQMKFLKKHKEIYDIERKANHFSGKEYQCVLTKEGATKRLTDLWDSI